MHTQTMHMYVYHKMYTCNERYFLCFWSAIIMRHIRWPSSALFIELYFRFSTRFSIFIELYFRFSILFSIFIHLYSRFDFCPLVFLIFIYLYYRFDFRPLVFSSKSGRVRSPRARMESHVCTCIPITVHWGYSTRCDGQTTL